ncbi:PIG-L deacetylase family protein [Bacillus sp. Marseille-P3661]|uniref:PIG-L deacetylase family protein n=1 Tax=Bacillus sp. Marseille-P3661 TaxID=1936234 RepID=UPI000C827F80|nr:PIG-L deacetylase family protein [Bacillus sp. Marseille-P3661]
MNSENKGTLFIISAHSGDFVWRAGGAIALYNKLGYKVRILCLSFGEIGESASLWKQGKSLEQIKDIRRHEAERAAEVLGAEIRFFDLGDYPLELNNELRISIVQELREHNAEIVLTHTEKDIYNMDHQRAYQLAIECCILANYGHGIPSEHPVTQPIKLFQFEPHQPEQCNFKLDTLLDITDVFETKRKAMEIMKAQKHIWEYYTDLARRRGLQANRNSGNSRIIYAEAFHRVYPQVCTSEF